MSQVKVFVHRLGTYAKPYTSWRDRVKLETEKEKDETSSKYQTPAYDAFLFSAGKFYLVRSGRICKESGHTTLGKMELRRALHKAGIDPVHINKEEKEEPKKKPEIVKPKVEEDSKTGSGSSVPGYYSRFSDYGLASPHLPTSSKIEEAR